jgi:hypothetical protein
MKIKYLENIHNLDNYCSIVKGGSNKSGVNTNAAINLVKDEGQYSMEFVNTDVRDYVLSCIWTEWEKGTDFFDIDSLVNTYIDAKKYNL